MELDQDLFFISMAARMLGMHPQTLRKYERLGLVQPTRTIGSMRLYSRDELERLKLIKRLVDDGGINLAGVQRLLSIAEVVQRLRPLMRDEALSARDARRRLVAGARRAEPHAGLRLDHGLQGLLLHARRRQDRHREGNQAGVPEAGAQAPSRRQPGRQGGRGAGSRRSTRRTRCSAIPRSGRSTTSSAPTGGSTSRPARAGRRSAARAAAGTSTSAAAAQGGGFRTMTARRDARDVRGRRIRSPTSSTRSSAAAAAARSRAARARPRRARAAARRAATSSRRSSSALEDAYHGTMRRLLDQARRPRAHRGRADSGRRRRRIARARRRRRRARAPAARSPAICTCASGSRRIRQFERKGTRPLHARRRCR